MIGNIIGRITGSIGTFFTRRLGEDRARALKITIGLICFAIFMVACFFRIQEWQVERHAKRVSDAGQQYSRNELDSFHFRADKNYLFGNYEEALKGFTHFLNQFPAVLYTENSSAPNVERSNKVDEAIIKVVLSLRKLNKSEEFSYHVKSFRNKFPKSKLVVNSNSDQTSILGSYHSGIFSLYDTRRHLSDWGEMIEGLPSVSTIEKWRWTEELSESTRENFETARESFKNLLSNEDLNQFPYSALRVEALYFIAKSYFIEGNYRRAYQEFDKITTTEFGNYPDLQDDAMYYTAYCLKERRVYDEAFGRYTEFMTRFPKSEYVTDAYFDLGKIYATRKEYDNARDSYASALQRAKDQSHKIELQLAEARANYKSGNDKRAEDKVDEAQVEYEKAIDIYRRLSAEYLEDSFLIKALNLISEFPKKSGDWNKDIEEKIKAYERFVRKYGQDREARFHQAIGLAYYDQGNIAKTQGSYQNAIDSYEDLLEKYPKSSFSPTAKLIIANIYNKLDKHPESVKAYERIIDDFKYDYKEGDGIWSTINGSSKNTDPRVFSMYEIGEAYSEMQNFEQALEWYLKITEKNGFKPDDTSDALDFRKDDLAPDALSGAMQALSELKRSEELANIATMYIENLRSDSPFLSAEAQLNFAHIKQNEADQFNKAAEPDKAALKYKEAALEYKKLNRKFELNENAEASGYLPDPNLRFNLIKLHGKYYEGFCYEKSGTQKETNSDPSVVGAYKEVTTLFKATFQPLLDAPNIPIPNRDYYITEATKIFTDLVNRHPKSENAAYWQYLSGEFYFAKKNFEKAIAEYQKVRKNYPTSNYIKECNNRIEEIREKMGSSDASGNSGLFGEARTKKQLMPEMIAQNASDSTVFLGINSGRREYSENGEMFHDYYGSGFFVSPSHIVTNFHVIAGKKSGYAYHVGKKLSYAIKGVVAADEKRDLAILEVSAFNVPSLPLGNSDNVKVGETVYVAGSPKGQIDTISDGIISRLRPFKIFRFRSGQEIRAERIQITAPTSPGSSGGPVLNNKGEIIGINHAGVGSPDAENINFAIPVNYLEKLLKRVGPPEPLKNFKITSRQ